MKYSSILNPLFALSLLCLAPVVARAEDDDFEEETPLTVEQQIAVGAQEAFADALAGAAKLSCFQSCAENEEAYVDCIQAYLKTARRELSRSARIYKLPTSKVVPDGETLLGQVRSRLFEAASSCDAGEPSAEE